MEIKKWRQLKKTVICETARWAHSQKEYLFRLDFNPVIWLFEQNLGAVKQNDYFPFPHKNASAKARDADFRHPCKTFWVKLTFSLFDREIYTSWE